MSEANQEGNVGAAESEWKKETDEHGEKYYGYDLYPERKSPLTFDWYTTIFHGNRKVLQKRKCEKAAYESLTSNPLVRILLSSLRNAGCPVDIGKNICCELCAKSVTGGYDIEKNQIVLCQNTGNLKKAANTTLVHELIHMYDYCVNEVDFRNLDHLACSEIRAANIAHCSFMSSFFLGQSNLFNIKETHKYCVQVKAAQSLMIARNLDQDTAMKLVLKVFDKCYNDLEPIGRRIRRNSPNPRLAYEEHEHFSPSFQKHT